MRIRTIFVAALFVGSALCGATLASGAKEVSLSSGQTVYVSVYSSVFLGPKGTPLGLETLLSIRNTDMKRGLTINSIDYYDTQGRLLRRHLNSPVMLGPLATRYIHVKEKESAGGPGANFIVRWQGAKPMNPPIVETVMVSSRGGQGISFLIPGQVISEE